MLFVGPDGLSFPQLCSVWVVLQSAVLCVSVTCLERALVAAGQSGSCSLVWQYELDVDCVLF